jgi:hypothetical protein
MQTADHSACQSRVDPHIPIPDPMTVRRLIGVRSAELALLRRLLRIATDRAKLVMVAPRQGVAGG